MLLRKATSNTHTRDSDEGFGLRSENFPPSVDASPCHLTQCSTSLHQASFPNPRRLNLKLFIGKYIRKLPGPHTHVQQGTVSTGMDSCVFSASRLDTSAMQFHSLGAFFSGTQFASRCIFPVSGHGNKSPPICLRSCAMFLHWVPGTVDLEHHHVATTIGVAI